MHITGYLSNWLNGIGRPDLATKAVNNQMPELNTAEAKDVFARWQRNEISCEECLDTILSIEIAQPKL